jgi:hypothetical protein
MVVLNKNNITILRLEEYLKIEMVHTAGSSKSSSKKKEVIHNDLHLEMEEQTERGKIRIQVWPDSPRPLAAELETLLLNVTRTLETMESHHLLCFKVGTP